MKNRKLTVPIPYPFLNLITVVITSKKLNHFINKAIQRDGEKFVFPQIEKQDLKPLIKGLSRHKGLVLVDTKLKDGTEVTVKL